MSLQEIATQKMNKAQLQKLIDILTKQIDHKIETTGTAPDRLYNRLHTYVVIFVNRFNSLPN